MNIELVHARVTRAIVATSKASGIRFSLHAFETLKVSGWRTTLPFKASREGLHSILARYDYILFLCNAPA